MTAPVVTIGTVGGTTFIYGTIFAPDLQLNWVNAGGVNQGFL